MPRPSCCPGLCLTVVTLGPGLPQPLRQSRPGGQHRGGVGARGGSTRKPAARAKGPGEGQGAGLRRSWGACRSGPGQPRGFGPACGMCLDLGWRGVPDRPPRHVEPPRCRAWPGKRQEGTVASGSHALPVRPVGRAGWGGDGPEVRKGLWSRRPGLVPPAALGTCRGARQAFAHSFANGRCRRGRLPEGSMWGC